MCKSSLGALARCAAAATLTALVAGCGPTATARTDVTDGFGAGSVPVDAGAGRASGRLKVVATTTLIGDIVSRVGGEDVDLKVIMPRGVDPHSYEPTPADVAAIADADVVFMNGLGLEELIEPLIENAGGSARVVAVSRGIETVGLEGEHGSHDDSADREDEAAPQDDRESHDEGDGRSRDDYGLHVVDPHVWFDPANVAVWTENVATTLGDLDPDRFEVYRDRAGTYRIELDELDRWIVEQVAAIPPARRRLVTDHQVLGYFAKRYGFEQVGSLHGFSTLSEPSAAELARLMDRIEELAVPAVFVGTTVNPSLAERVARDTGTRVAVIYTGSLSEPGSPAATYVGFMRHNVSAIVEALE